MENLIPEPQLDKKRIEKFTAQVRDICRSSKSFRKRIDIDVSHIAWRAGTAGQDIRNAMDAEKMASLILNGEICLPNCKTTSPLEIVFDGRFKEIIETQFNPIREVKHINVGFRIVVREGSHKHIIVTVHPLNLEPTLLEKLPEIPNEVWQ